MGYNNGYDAGYDDAKAELMPKIRALEAQLASAGGADSASFNIGPSTGPVALRNNALNVVSVDTTLVPVGGWEDRATTGADRPDPIWDDGYDGWYVDYDLSMDPFFLGDGLVVHDVGAT